MLTLLFSFLLTAAEPAQTADAVETVQCNATYQTRSGRTFRVRVTCPDVENQESLIRQTQRQIEEAESVLRDLSIRDLPGQVQFQRIETEAGVDWQVLPGVISRINAYYPENPTRAGVPGACTARYDIINGVPENICIRCRASEHRGDFIREMRRAIRRSFYVETAEPLEQIFSVEFPMEDAPSPGIPGVPNCEDN